MEENNYSVYVHTNKLNNKKYVGLTKKRPKDRWQRGNGYTHSIYFYSAIQKYGWDGFYHDVVADCLSKEEGLRNVYHYHQWKFNKRKVKYFE